MARITIKTPFSLPLEAVSYQLFEFLQSVAEQKLEIFQTDQKKLMVTTCQDLKDNYTFKDGFYERHTATPGGL
jgi:hypothetical protein